MKTSNVNKEAEAIEFLKSIGYRFDANEKQFFPGKEEIAETYPLDFLKERLAYNDMLLQEPFNKDIIDTFFHYLHNAVNTTKGMIRVNGENKPSSVVVSVLLKLNYFDFLYAIQKYRQNTTKVNNHGAYIVTILYNAKAQNEADITNQVQHDMYGLKD